MNFHCHIANNELDPSHSEQSHEKIQNPSLYACIGQHSYLAHFLGYVTCFNQQWTKPRVFVFFELCFLFLGHKNLHLQSLMEFGSVEFEQHHRFSCDSCLLWNIKSRLNFFFFSQLICVVDFFLQLYKCQSTKPFGVCGNDFLTFRSKTLFIWFCASMDSNADCVVCLFE